MRHLEHSYTIYHKAKTLDKGQNNATLETILIQIHKGIERILTSASKRFTIEIISQID